MALYFAHTSMLGCVSRVSRRSAKFSDNRNDLGGVRERVARRLVQRFANARFQRRALRGEIDRAEIRGGERHFADRIFRMAEDAALAALHGFAASNPDALERFERAVSDASAYVNAHHDVIIPLLASFTKLDPALIARTMKGSDAQYLDAKDIQPMIDVSAKFGMIAKSFKAEDMMSPVLLKPPTSH